MSPMNDYVKAYGSIALAITTVMVSLVTQWAVYGIRIANVESRQDRQAAAIMVIQGQITDQVANYAALQAKLDAIKDNVDYIRSRIDRATQ